MPAVKVNDINIYYEIHGEGEPLVFINGAGATTRGWEWAIPVFSPEFRMVLFDTRGAGQSDKPDIPYTMEMMADDVAGLLDAIGTDGAHIIGVSMGGMIAQHFALRYSNRVRSLILGCTSCGGPHTTMNSAEVVRLWDMYRLQKLTLEEMIMESLRLAFTQEFLDENLARIQQGTTGMMERPPNMMRYIEAMTDHDTYESLPEIKAPTLVIAGDADRLIPAENSRLLSSRIPGAELVIFKNTGHAFAEAGGEFVRVMLDFLRQHPQSG